MFDQPNKNVQPPTNLPIGDQPKVSVSNPAKSNPYEDALERVAGSADSEPRGPIISSISEAAEPQSQYIGDELDEKSNKIYFILGGVVLLLIIGGAGAWAFTRGGSVPANNTNLSEQNTNIEQSVNTNIINTNIDQNINTAPVVNQNINQNTNTVPVVVDSDGDGLTNEEEVLLGTNPNLVDSDNDGLSDREEIKVYKTDPLNPDTDGDTYKDGDEIKNGYNPKGPGKLLEIPKP